MHGLASNTRRRASPNLTPSRAMIHADKPVGAQQQPSRYGTLHTLLTRGGRETYRGLRLCFLTVRKHSARERSRPQPGLQRQGWCGVRVTRRQWRHTTTRAITRGPTLCDEVQAARYVAKQVVAGHVQNVDAHALHCLSTERATPHRQTTCAGSPRTHAPTARTCDASLSPPPILSTACTPRALRSSTSRAARAEPR